MVTIFLNGILISVGPISLSIFSFRFIVIGFATSSAVDHTLETSLPCRNFFILPIGPSSFKGSIKVGVKVYHSLNSVIKKKQRQGATNVGDEGGFSPNMRHNMVLKPGTH